MFARRLHPPLRRAPEHVRRARTPPLRGPWSRGARGGVVENQTSTDPGFVELGPSTGIGITFPAVLPSGNSPDVEFPAGASLQVEVEATNSVASDTYTSGSITPA